MLGGQPWIAGTVLDADPAARHLGVRRGIPLGSAHRLAPEATFLDPEPEADRAAVEAAFETLATFSPAIAGSADPADQSFGLLEAQVDGLELLWGPEPVLVERIGAALAPALAGRPRSGIAGTRFAAMVAAAAAEPGALISVPPSGEAAFLAPMPTSLLTQEPEVRARLHRFGLRRIGQVAELAASALVARFGEEGARIGARARGEETDPFRPRRAPERLLLALPIEPPVAELEAVRFVLRRIATALAANLAARGLAAARGQVRLELDLAFARAGTPGRVDRRGTVSGADRRRGGNRAPAPGATRTDATAGSGRAPRAGADRRGAGGGPAIADVRAPGPARCAPALATRAVGTDLWGGSHSQRGRHGSRGAAG